MGGWRLTLSLESQRHSTLRVQLQICGGIMRLSKFLTEDIKTKTVNLTLTFDERSELLRHLEMFDENIDQLHPLVESVQDKLLGID